MKVYALILWKMIHDTDRTSEQVRVHGTLELSQQRKDQYKYGLSWVLQQRLIQATARAQHHPKWSNILELNSLRLVYLTSHLDDTSANGFSNDGHGNLGKATYLDYPLGSSQLEFQSILDQTEQEVKQIAGEIKRLVDMQSPHEWKHCDWRYCSCHELRRKFVRGSVYQDPDMH